MKILLLGANGQLGHELSRILPSLGVVKLCRRIDVDLTNECAIVNAVDTFQPDVIVNAAAYTAVDKAESERDLAFRVNAEAVGVLAWKAAERNIWLVHYSTDYVFDGSKTESYAEIDRPNPINVYGASKLAGEQAVIASNCKHLIFRVAWVIGQDGNNFARTILALATERKVLRVTNDQFGVPTAPKLIAQVTMDAMQSIAQKSPWSSGVYHLAPHGRTTWYGVAKTLLQLAQEAQIALVADENSLQAITTEHYPTLAKRPANSQFDTSKLAQQLTFHLPHWRDDFFTVSKEIIKEMKA